MFGDALQCGSSSDAATGPVADFGRIRISNTALGRDAIELGLFDGRATVATCDKDASDARPRGLDVAFAIDRDGHVTSVHASGSGDAAIDRCVEARLAAIRFPPPSDRLDVTCRLWLSSR